MKILDKEKINVDYAPYENFFECDESEINKILEFLLYTNKSRKKISESKFVQSSFWETLSSARYTAFSNNLLMIKSADRFLSSPFISYHYDSSLDNNIKAKIKFLFRNIKVFLKYFLRWDTETGGANPINKELVRFEKYFPNFVKPENHNELMKHYPTRYIDHLEPMQLINHDRKDTFLEIGPANCVNVALQISHRKIKKTFLIDLPEQISFGYCFLKIFFKDTLKIGLPHEINENNINDFDIVFLLPHQSELIPDKIIDLAMNVSSFQEMNLSAVNNYISLLEKKLKKGGQFISVNQIEANYVPGNNLANWNLSKFQIEKFHPSFTASRKATLAIKKFKQVILNCILN